MGVRVSFETLPGSMFASGAPQTFAHVVDRNRWRARVYEAALRQYFYARGVSLNTPDSADPDDDPPMPEVIRTFARLHSSDAVFAIWEAEKPS